MRYISTATVSLLILTLDLSFAAQYPGPYPPGGGYPNPGGYPTGPSIPVPRRSKDKNVNNKSPQPIQSLTGILRTIEATSLTIIAPDTRTITAKLSGTVKVFRKGEESSIASLKTGDRIRIDATQDEQGFFHAVAIHLESEELPQARSTQQEATPPSMKKSAEGEVEEEVDSAHRDRATPRVVTGPGTPGDMDPDRPRLRRGKPAARKTAATAETTSSEPVAPTPVEARSSAQPEPTMVAANRPGTAADQSDATGSREDVVIARARQAITAYTQSLPNFYCREQIARFASTTQKVDWRPLDVLSATVVFENGRDEYRDLTINGKPVNKRMEEMGGAWSTGEFGMIAADLFSPATAAEFASRSTSRIAGKDAVVYDFEVDREHSHWHIQAPSQSVLPAYKGSVWLEKDTAQVLRIEMQTYRMPKEFPLDKVESAVDYEYVRLGENLFLLPVHAETLTCVRGTSNCSRNVIDFRNYRKYGAESTITVDK